jgi:putative transposase
MKAWRGQYPVPVMAHVLEVSKAGFYAWLKRPPSQRAQEEERLKVAVLATHRKTRETYGTRYRLARN